MLFSGSQNRLTLYLADSLIFARAHDFTWQFLGTDSIDSGSAQDRPLQVRWIAKSAGCSVGAPLVGALLLLGCCEALTAIGKDCRSVEHSIP